MRSTVDIYDVLDEALRERARRLGVSYKEVINQVLAAGLQQLDQVQEPARPYRVKAKACGFRPGIDTNHLNRLVDETEDEEYRP